MADLEFFFDPVCPWAWITSRWVTEVQQLRNYEVTGGSSRSWMLNESPRRRRGTRPSTRPVHLAGLQGCASPTRCASETATTRSARCTPRSARRSTSTGGVEELLADPVAFMARTARRRRAPTDLAAHAHDESHDAYIRAETDARLRAHRARTSARRSSRSTRAADEASFFGPVISKAPRGEDALRLWDAVETLATTARMAELKRSNRAPLDFT